MVCSQEEAGSAQPIYPQYMDMNLKYTNVKDGTERMVATASFREEPEAKYGRLWEVTINGQGEWMGYVDTKISQSAKFIHHEVGLRVLETESVVFDEQGNDAARFVKEYDYDRNTVIVVKRGGVAAHKFERFEMLGPTCDDVSLVHFLKAYNARDFVNEPYQVFYLVTNEPKMYKVRMIYVANDTLETNGVSRKAIKYQLKADFGPLTDIVAKMVPPTYVWYSRDYPFEFLQYQGMESGFRSAYIKATVIGWSYQSAGQ